MFNSFRRLNEKGASKMAIFVITLIVIILISGFITIYYQFIHKEKFSEEEIAAAQEVAKEELGKAMATSENFTFDQRLEAIQSIGYNEPTLDNTDYIFEKQDSENYYILLRMQPHELYEHVTKVIVQVFDKKNGALITDVSNMIKWEK